MQSDTESEGEEYTNPKYLQFNTSDSFVNRFCQPTQRPYEQDLFQDPLLSNPQYSLGLSPHLNQSSNQTQTGPNLRKKKVQTLFSVMEKLGTCKKFSGYPHENGNKFIKEFESFAILHELDDYEEDETVDETRKLAAFHLHLQGPALTWFSGLAPELTWDNVKAQFIAKYVYLIGKTLQ